MAFVVTNITNWVNENSQTLIEQAVLKPVTVANIAVMSGIKWKSTIKYMDNPIVFQAGGCGLSASGSLTLDDKEVSVTSLAMVEDLCPEDLNKTSLSLSLRPGFNTSVPFEGQVITHKVGKVKEAIEKQIWANFSGSTTAVQGLTYKILHDSDCVSSVTFNTLATGHTASNWVEFAYDMINSVDAAVASEPLTWFVGQDVFNKVSQAFIQATSSSLFSYAGPTGAMEYMIPGTNVRMLVAPGLNGLGYTVLTPAMNLVYLTDLENEEEKVQMIWIEADDIVRLKIRVKFGIDYFFGEYITMNRLA